MSALVELLDVVDRILNSTQLGEVFVGDLNPVAVLGLHGDLHHGERIDVEIVDEAGHDLSDVRPETLPGAVDTLELLDSAVTALGGQRREGQRFMAAKVAEALETGRKAPDAEVSTLSEATKLLGA